MGRRALLIGVMLLAGCASGTLSPEWAPLERIRERPGDDRVVTTIGSTLYVSDLKRFNANRPVGSPERRALLLHEREHARRQLAYGLFSWLVRYLKDKNFRWEEEKAGYRLEIKHLQRHRRWRPGDTERVAKGMEKHYVGMVTRAEARAWIESVLRGD